MDDHDDQTIEQSRARTGRIALALAWLVVKARWLIVPAWIAAAVYVAFWSSALEERPSEVVSLTPDDSAAVATEIRAASLFRIPVSTHTAVVQRDPDGLSAEAMQRVVERAVQQDQRVADGIAQQRFFALPAVNAAGAFPASREANTTGVTWLGFPATTSYLDMDATSHDYADAIRAEPGSGDVGVTGIVSAQLHEGTLVEGALPIIEVATVLLIALVVGLKYRAPGAPVVTLLTVGIAYTVSMWALDYASQVVDVSIPSVLRPLIIALVLGIVTDYSVFYLSSYRAKLLHAGERVACAQSTAAEIAPIVLAGGFILAAGLLALLAASVSFFQRLGPGLALVVVVSLVVSLTLIPALLAIAGRFLFWPSLREAGSGRRGARAAPSLRERYARFSTRRPVALATVLVAGGLLGYAALQLDDARLGFTNISGLPPDSEERRAAEAAAEGFAPGIISPTQVLVEGQGLGAREDGLRAFEDALGREPGIAAVVGAREQPPDEDLQFAVSENGNAARYLVVLDDEPLSAQAIDTVHRLEPRLAALASDAGLDGARVSLAGDTAVAEETVTTFQTDFLKITAAVLAVNFVMLVIFLRAIVAPLYLIAASVLAVAATFGIATWFFQDLLAYGQLTYYVPFATAVLLVSLGSDYNVFVIGRVWQEAKLRPLDEALAVAAPRAASAIRAAGLTLAASFAVLAVVPLHAFWEFAFTMAVGILLETFVVRSLLVPALVALFGYASGWPGRGLELRAPARAPAAAGEAPPAAG